MLGAVCTVLLLLQTVDSVTALDADVAGPVVELKTAPATPNINSTSSGLKTNSSEAPKQQTIAEFIDKALQKEFKEEQQNFESDLGKSYNKSASVEENTIETVVRISGNSVKPDKPEEEKKDETSAGANKSSIANVTATGTTTEPAVAEDTAMPHYDKAVDRIIDSRDNEFVLSTPKDSVAALTLDPQLIQDVTFMLAAGAALGMLFESVKQPVINGYLMAGALVGPGGFQLIKELVQVESLAQLGVQLLLFGLGLELSLSKLRAVWSVALIGGSLQILLFMVMAGVVAAVVGASVSQGIFIGALLSMSSTSVVVKCLEVSKSTNSLHGQITIGTLIVQDCSVGLMFALMPVLGASGAVSVANDSAAHTRMITGAVLLVLAKLVSALLAALLLVRTVLPVLLRSLLRNASRELVQLSLVGFCLMTAWSSGWLGLSEELGAFMAGAMLAVCEFQMPGEGSRVSLHIESVQNVLTALFVSSIGLLMSPIFLMEHMPVLALCTVCVFLMKALLITGVVHFFGVPMRTAIVVAVSMAHIGEFSFVLLSMANQHHLLSTQVYMLLLGITALSLLTTPLVISICNRLVRTESGSFRSLHGPARSHSCSSPHSPLCDKEKVQNDDVPL